ncbi:hypothetical protein P3T36_003481 [Kitasatospora sp. MAP12-15]|uniref:hypothetical protein n=1 Tax=unclassified Kitasatospora TaxID=2633591 RepID=UPI0024738C12|nr:hypothetical protein [Kitasatospora sp. MAP12-44]MDH6110443.1 hypothetical protein [Kitasatospora sp. MAP12-44]
MKRSTSHSAGTPWSVRTSARRDGRPVLEIYEHGELLDVVVASSFTGELLRGARRCSGGGRSAGLAWGRLAADHSLPQVAFSAGRLRPRWRPVQLAVVAREFWVARSVDGVAGVLLRHPDGSTEHLRPHRSGGHCARAV